MAGSVFDEKRIPLGIYRACTGAFKTYREDYIALQRRVFLGYRYIGRSNTRYTEAAVIESRHVLVVEEVDTFHLHRQAVSGMVRTDTVGASSGVREPLRHAKVTIPIRKGQRELYRVYRGTRIGQPYQRI